MCSSDLQSSEHDGPGEYEQHVKQPYPQQNIAFDLRTFLFHRPSVFDDFARRRRVGELDAAFALKTGTLYPLLHSLEEKELIRSYEKDEGAARPRRYYHLERKGQHLLREKEVEWATFTTAVDRVLKGGVCLGSA